MSLRRLDLLLENDASGATRDELVTCLEAMRDSCNAELQGLAGEEAYLRCKAIRDACVTAQRVVRIVWRRTQRSAPCQ